MYWFLLIVCSLPVYFLIGWLIFDTGENAAESIVDTLVLALKEVFFYPFFYFFSGRDVDRAGSAMALGLFVVVCCAATYGEHLLVQRFLHGLTATQEQAELAQ